MLVSARAEA